MFWHVCTPTAFVFDSLGRTHDLSDFDGPAQQPERAAGIPTGVGAILAWKRGLSQPATPVRKSSIAILSPRGKLGSILGLPRFARTCKPGSLLLSSGLDSQRLQSTSRDSVAPGQIHDGGLDGRRQAVPVCDQLAECLVLPAHFRPAQGTLAITSLGFSVCVRLTAGAIPAAPPRYRRFLRRIGILATACFPAPPLLRSTYADGAQSPLPERHGQRGRFGNKLGTVLAMSAQCDYNVHASVKYRNCL